MALSVRCQCGKTYELKDEYAGRLIRCPRCQAISRADRAAYTPASQVDPVFNRDIFVFPRDPRRRDHAYAVSDESGAPIVLVEPPARVRRGLTLVVGWGAALLSLGVVVRHAATLGKGVGSTALIVVGGLTALLVPHVLAAAIAPRRDIVLHRSERKRERLLEIVQEGALWFVGPTYTLYDAAGQPVARLRKTVLNPLRRRWEVRTLADHLVFVATEPSLFDALRYRVASAFSRPGRAHIVFYAHDGRAKLGEFTRDATTSDRYILDLRRDRHRKLDRPVALALGVMLEMEERRG